MFVDLELRFAASAPIDPLGPLKDVLYTEDCEGYICDLYDVQILPGLCFTYQNSFHRFYLIGDILFSIN